MRVHRGTHWSTQRGTKGCKETDVELYTKGHIEVHLV